MLQLFVLNRVWQIVRWMFVSGSNNREAAVLKDVITTGMRSLVTRLVLLTFSGNTTNIAN